MTGRVNRPEGGNSKLETGNWKLRWVWRRLISEEVLTGENGNVLEDEEVVFTHSYFLRQRTPSFVSSSRMPRADN